MRLVFPAHRVYTTSYARIGISYSRNLYFLHKAWKKYSSVGFPLSFEQSMVKDSHRNKELGAGLNDWREGAGIREKKKSPLSSVVVFSSAATKYQHLKLCKMYQSLNYFNRMNFWFCEDII